MSGRPTVDDLNVIGLFLEGFFYGLYSGIFALYLHYHASNKESKKTHNVIFCSICILYVLSTGLFVSELSDLIIALLGKSIDSLFHVTLIQGILFGCCDSISQFILIYRCWIVWSHNIHVVIIPSLLTLGFLATWLAGAESDYIVSDQLVEPGWAGRMFFSTLGLSLTVNALVTGLIVFRIFKVFQQVKVTSDNRYLGATGGSGKLRHIIFILIESGMTLFAIQLIRLVVNCVMTDVAMEASEIVIGIHEMLTGITPTIILVRISMGLTFDGEKSMEAFAIESLRFQVASNDSNSVPETGSIRIADQNSRNDDDIASNQQNSDIEPVER